MMNDYKVIGYTEEHKLLWNEFVATSKNATFLFYRDFMEYHQDRFEDFSLMVFNEDVLVALLPANIVSNEVHSHQGLSYGGFLIQADCCFRDVLLIFNSVLKFLNSNSIEVLHLKLLPKIYHHLSSDEIDYLLFIINAEIERRDLTEAIDFTKKTLISSSNRKRALKKAIKNGLIVKEVNQFDEFWNEILEPNLETQHQAKPVHSLNEITFLKTKFSSQIRQFNAYHNSRIVAGVTIFETEMVAHAQYISASQQKQQLGSLDIIFDYLINDRYKEKRYFDFGISNQNQGKAINLGLLSWKESYGAKPIVHDFYRIKTENFYLLNEVLK